MAIIGFYEVVRIHSLPPDWKESFVPTEGVVIGRCDPMPDGTVAYAVYLHEIRRSRVFAREHLEPIGRTVQREDLPPPPGSWALGIRARGKSK
jgi:hypothetical protein